MIYSRLILVFLISIGSFISNEALSQSKKRTTFDEAKFSSLLIQGVTAKISGDFYLADSLLNACIKINPNDPVSYFELSGILLEKGDEYEAINMAQKAVEIEPNKEWYLTNLAIIYQNIKNFKSASICFEKLCKTHPNKIEYLFSLAECYMQDKNYKKAIKCLDKIESINGLSQDLSLQKHQIFIYLRKKKKALNELKKLVEKKPEDIRNYGLLGEYYQSIGRKKDAFEVFQKMVAIDSSNGLVRLSLFQYYYRIGKHEKAVNELLSVMDSYDVEENIKLEILLQISYEKNSLFTISELENLLKKFLLLHKKNSAAFLLFADIKFLQNKNDSAAIFLRKSLSINPMPFEVWSQLLTSELSSKKFLITIEDAKKAITHHPNQPLSYLVLGVAQSSINKYELALKNLKSGISLVVDDSLLLSDYEHHIGNAYYKLGEIENSFIYFEKAVKHNPNNPILLNNYSYYMAEQEADLDLAEDLILKALEYFPNNSTFLDTYGWVLFKKEDFLKAEIYINKAINKALEDNGALLEHYGDVLFKLGQKEEAIIFWKKAQKMKGVSKKIETKINEEKYIK
ncbi:MAG: hypothetical protein CL846_08195 [Crocinitomicaceae bacterium]|nr:hypothetical protein [Crocinitomicaceae bacterium]